MAEVSKADKQGVKASLVNRNRKSIAHLQKLKDEGTPIVQMCPMIRDQFWVKAAEMANVDVCRLTVPGDGNRIWIGSHILLPGGSGLSVTRRSLSTSIFI